ncbi:MAG TPA: hypothetical protein ENK72_00120 [Epsilonproteobacteria bacterium]|nr:hypothetical protein [Campylobacterota bacterium]
MEFYSEEKNRKAVQFLFRTFQIVMVLIVYSFAYMTLLGVNAAMEKKAITWAAYLPVVVTFAVYPVLLYKMQGVYEKGNVIRATGSTLGFASLLIVILYFHLSNLI